MQKLAIVGSHPNTRDNAPWGDPAFDIWVFNEAGQTEWCKRWDACFQMHKPDVYTSSANRMNADHWPWMQQDHPGKRIFMQAADERVPACVVYPLANAIALTGEQYFTSSFAYALALASLHDYEYIEIYGSDLTSNTEYSYQADCFRHWVGFLRGRGVTVKMLCWPTAFIAPLYGYEGEIQLGEQYYRERATSHNNGWLSADKHLRLMLKSIDAHFEKKEWLKVRDSVLRYQEAALECGEKSGAMSEAERYAAYGDRQIYRQEYEYHEALGQREGERTKILMYHQGGMVEYVWNIVSQSGHPQAVKQLRDFILQMGRYAYDTGAMHGVYAENRNYRLLFDDLVQAAGGKKAIEAIQCQ